jgi:hypothetical protein
MLVQSTSHIRAIIPVNALANFDTFEPYIDAIESQVFIPVLGQDLYDELEAVADDSGTDNQKALLKKIRYSLVNLMMYKGFDMLNVTYDDSGFERVSKDSGLYRYQEENLKSMFKNEGYNGLDTLLEYLQSNLDTFEKFKSSDFYADMQESFFPTTSVFNSIYNIGNSRLVFLQLSKYFTQLIDFKIKPLLGSALYANILAEMKKESDQDTELMALVPYIRKALAFMAVKEGLSEVGIQITDKGLFFEMQAEGSNSNVETQQINGGQMALMLHKADVNAQRYQEMLLDYLKENADMYTDFTQTNLENTNPYRRDNHGKKSFFA